MAQYTIVCISHTPKLAYTLTNKTSQRPPKILVLRLHSIRNPPHNKHLHPPPPNPLRLSRRPLPPPNATILPIPPLRTPPHHRPNRSPHLLRTRPPPLQAAPIRPPLRRRVPVRQAKNTMAETLGNIDAGVGNDTTRARACIHKSSYTVMV